MLLRVQASLTPHARTWLKRLPETHPCHTNARRWAATLLLPPAQLHALGE
jgi:hypothetical protein